MNKTNKELRDLIISSRFKGKQLILTDEEFAVAQSFGLVSEKTRVEMAWSPETRTQIANIDVELNELQSRITSLKDLKAELIAMPLFALMLMVLPLTSYSSDCNLTLKATKPSARSAQLSGVSFSAKQLSALRAHCIVTIKHLTKADKLEAYKLKLDREEQDMKAMFGAQDGE